MQPAQPPVRRKAAVVLGQLSCDSQAFSAPASAEGGSGSNGVRGEALFHSLWGSLGRGQVGRTKDCLRPNEREKLRPEPRGQGCGTETVGSGATGPLHLGCTPCTPSGPQSFLLVGACDPQSLLPQPRGGGSAREGSGQGAWGELGSTGRGPGVQGGSQFLAAMTTERATPPRATAVAPNSHFHGMDCG